MLGRRLASTFAVVIWLIFLFFLSIPIREDIAHTYYHHLPSTEYLSVLTTQFALPILGSNEVLNPEHSIRFYIVLGSHLGGSTYDFSLFLENKRTTNSPRVSLLRMVVLPSGYLRALPTRRIRFGAPIPLSLRRSYVSFGNWNSSWCDRNHRDGWSQSSCGSNWPFFENRCIHDRTHGRRLV